VEREGEKERREKGREGERERGRESILIGNILKSSICNMSKF
jgi:hypothetical protein